MLAQRPSFFKLFIAVGTILPICGCGVTCTVAPSISGQPFSQTVPSGKPLLLTVAASGSAPLSYIWLKNGVAIPDATKAAYITPAVSPEDSGSVFTVTVRNEFGILTSNPATLTVSASNDGSARFVSPTGDDSNPGTIDSPYRTIQHCATVVTQGGACEVRAGTYQETITPNSGVTIEAYNLETVVIDGSDPVSGWSLYQGSIYRASVAMRSDDTNQLFVGNDMMTEARWPNGDDLFHVKWAIAHAGTNVGHIADANIPNVNWTGAKVHLWSGEDPFGHETGTVTASGNGEVSIDVETGTCPDICPVPGGYYYLFGTLAALDREREWYYDSGSQTLYFMAPKKVDPNTIDVRSKQRQYAFDLRGKSGVTLRNLRVFASSILTDSASTNNNLDRINAQYVSHFTSLASGPSYSYQDWGGDWGILVVHSSDSGLILNGSGNIIQNSTISYSAGTGIALGGNNNVVKNNLITNVDYIGDYDSGIVIDGVGNTIQYNSIDTVGRQAILPNAVTNEDIGYNNLSNTMVLSRDGGAIYACCKQLASATRIHHNWIHDSNAVITGKGESFAIAGIVLDNNSSGFTIDQNVIWNNQTDDIHIYGADISAAGNNDIRNNTIPDSSAASSIYLESVANCAATHVADNKVARGVRTTGSGPGCAVTNNDSSAAGATEMPLGTEVGCNFEGCSSNPPCPFLSSGVVAPCPVTLATPNQ